MQIECAHCGREAAHHAKVDPPLFKRACQCGALPQWLRITPPPLPRAAHRQPRPFTRHGEPNSASIPEADYQAARIERERDRAERHAVAALARGKFAAFGYNAGLWVHLNRLCRVRRPNPFKAFVQAARIAKQAITEATGAKP